LSSLVKQLLICGLALFLTPLTLTSVGTIGALAIFSMAAIVILALVLGLRSYQCLYTNGLPSPSILPSLPPSLPSLLSALPVFVASFLCHFNLLPVYSELRFPTRDRAHSLIHFTMGSTFILYTFVGLLGWAYAVCRDNEASEGGKEGEGGEEGEVPDNLLLSFPSNDPLVNVARAALVVVLSFCFPLLLIPCRDALIRLVGVVRVEWKGGRAGGRERGRGGGRGAKTPLLGGGGVEEGEEGERGREFQREGGGGGGGGGGGREGGGAGGGERPDDDAHGRSIKAAASAASLPPPPPLNPGQAEQADQEQGRPRWLPSLLLTYLLVLFILSVAVQVDSVATIWAVLGSFACFAVSFILPPLAYLKVGCPRQKIKRLWAWVICVVGMVMMAACTVQTIGDLLEV